ncbi:MAG: hypothetical protein V2B19_23420 [Pseudomonadota bacterium]
MRNNERGLSLIVIVIVVFILAGAGAGGFFAFSYYKQKHQGPSKSSLPHNNMDAVLLDFTFHQLQSLYAKLELVNREINLIDGEIARLDALESSYPQQKGVIKTERVVWEKIKKSLLTVIQSFEKNIESIYVAYQVNAEKGKELMDAKTPELEASAEEIIKNSQAETTRIKVEPPQTLIEKLKAKFLK